jgi:hypothetical protein
VIVPKLRGPLSPCNAFTVGPICSAALAFACRRPPQSRPALPLKRNLMGSGGLPTYIRIVPVRGTFRTGERTFQCKTFMPFSPLGAQ